MSDDGHSDNSEKADDVFGLNEFIEDDMDVLTSDYFHQQNTECSICISADLPNSWVDEGGILLSTVLQTKSCGHTFHEPCLRSWLRSLILQERSGTCPMCRHELIRRYNTLDLNQQLISLRSRDVVYATAAVVPWQTLMKLTSDLIELFMSDDDVAEEITLIKRQRANLQAEIGRLGVESETLARRADRIEAEIERRERIEDGIDDDAEESDVEESDL